jgi:hypothetical protein
MRSRDSKVPLALNLVDGLPAQPPMVAGVHNTSFFADAIGDPVGLPFSGFQPEPAYLRLRSR